MIYDEEKDIHNVVSDIKKIQENNLQPTFDVEFVILNEASRQNVMTNKKSIKHLVKDMDLIFHNLGERKWKDDKNRYILKTHCDKLGFNYEELYECLIDNMCDRYFGTEPKTIKILKEKLQILSSLVQGTKLRNILADCFRPVNTIEYDKIKFILSNLLDDDYVYSIEKNDPTCEHVIPRKIFKNRQIYDSDMHNLFLCINKLNVIRDVKKFSQISNNNGKKYYGNKYTDDIFEPIDKSKGLIARSCAYFFTVYPELFSDITKCIDIDILKNWGLIKPDVTEHERNLFVYQIQHNINPYIIYPKLIEHAFNDVDEKCIILSSIEKQLKNECKTIKKNVNNLEFLLGKYNKYTDHNCKTTISILQLDKIKNQINMINNIWNQ